MANRLKGVFSATEAPFLLVLALGVFAWGATHIVDRLVESPILEISLASSANSTAELVDCVEGSVKTMDVPYLVDYTLRNISRTMVFNQVSFTIRLPEESKAKIVGVRLKAVAPAFQGERAETCAANYASFKDLKFHPGWQMMLYIAIDRQAIPEIHLSGSEKALFLKKTDIETRFIRHETKLILVLVVVTAAVAAGCLLYFLCRQARKSEPGSIPPSHDSPKGPDTCSE